jgi:hypothetical protein
MIEDDNVVVVNVFQKPLYIKEINKYFPNDQTPRVINRELFYKYKDWLMLLKDETIELQKKEEIKRNEKERLFKEMVKKLNRFSIIKSLCF